jgi:hypothetical protein
MNCAQPAPSIIVCNIKLAEGLVAGNATDDKVTVLVDGIITFSQTRLLTVDSSLTRAASNNAVMTTGEFFKRGSNKVAKNNGSADACVKSNRLLSCVVSAAINAFVLGCNVSFFSLTIRKFQLTNAFLML